MLEQFHFLAPAWLLTLLPLVALLWYLWHKPDAANPWRRVIAPHLQPLLLRSAGVGAGRHRRRWLLLLSAGWLLAVLALANPAWEQHPRPVFQSQTARVIVLDLSRSMLASDLQPDRLTRARFKVEDLLRLAGEGQIALVAFAGDAFTVTPLTRDMNTLRSQLHALEPDIMPAQGSRADLGLRRAGELLRQAGLQRGEVLLLADGVQGNDAVVAATALKQAGYGVAVLGVGTAAGAPVPDAGGHAMRDPNGGIVMAGLQASALQAVAAAGGGPYVELSNDDRDVRALLAAGTPAAAERRPDTMAAAPQWEERGPWLAVALLALATLAFRRGALFGVALLALGLVPAPPAGAAVSNWADLWQSPEQQAQQALARGDYARASGLARDPLRRGAARYKQGDYRAALTDFRQAQGPEASYNRGNALAQLGRYEEALAAYREALAERPDMVDARANQAAVEALLERRRQEQQGSRQDTPAGQQGEQPEHGQTSQQQQQGSRQDTPPGQQGEQPKQGETSRQGQQGQPGSDAGKGRSAGGGQEQAGADQQQPLDAERGRDTGKAHAQGNATRDSGAAAGLPADAGKGAVEQQPGSGSRTDRPGVADQRTAQAATAAASDSQSSTKGQPERNPFRDALRTLGQQETERDSAPPSPAPERHPVGVAAAGSHAAEALSSEERLAAEQWLRRIPDDPGGLLRRKFLYQYQQRQGRAAGGGAQAW